MDAPSNNLGFCKIIIIITNYQAVRVSPFGNPRYVYEASLSLGVTVRSKPASPSSTRLQRVPLNVPL